MAKNIFKLIPYNLNIINSVQLFNSKLINKIKSKATSTLYEKLKLIVQTYNDKGKKEILIQLPIIQQFNQKIILALALTLIKKVKFYL